MAPDRPGSRLHLAFAAFVAGLAIAIVAQHVAPLAGPPLHDGVVVTDPYRWLSPPPGQLGGAQGVSATVAVQGDSPVVAIATPEDPPQAQVFAAPGTLALPQGTTSLKLSIDPIAPSGEPQDGTIAGNEYRIVVATQTGAAVAGKVGDDVSVVIRGPANVPDATIERFSDTGWQPLPTDSSGLPDTFLAVVTDFGDFALVVPSVATAPATYPSGEQASESMPSTPTLTPNATESGRRGRSILPPAIPPLTVAGLAVIGATVLLAGFVAWRRRRID